MSSIDGTNSIFANTIDGLTNIDTNTITINGQTTDQLYVRNDMTNNTNISNNLNMGAYGVTASSFTDNNFTGNKALISDGTKKIEESGTTSTELGFLSGASSNIQTQLNNRALSQFFNGSAYSSPALTQGSFIQWNAPPFVGKMYLTCSKGLGRGGFVFEVWDNVNNVLDSTPLDIDGPNQLITSTYDADFGNRKITTTYVPVNNVDLVNKLYVDNLIGGFVDLTSAQTIGGTKTFAKISTTVSGAVNRFPIAVFNYDGLVSDYLDLQSNLFKSSILDYLPMALNRLGGNVSIGKVPNYSSSYKLDVNGGVQCGIFNSTGSTFLANNAGRYLEVDSAPNVFYLDFHTGTTTPTDFDARILVGGGTSAPGQGTLELTALQTNMIGGKVQVNSSSSSVSHGSLNVRTIGNPFGGFAGGLTLEADPATGWSGNNAIDFIQNFGGGNGQWKIYPQLDTATGTTGQLRFKIFQSGTFPNLPVNNVLVLQSNNTGSTRGVGINKEPNLALGYGLDASNDTIACNDLYHINMAYGFFNSYGVAQLCPAGANTVLFFNPFTATSFGITQNPFDQFFFNKAGVYEIILSAWCIPFGPTQAIFTIRNSALAVIGRLALVIDPANGSTVSIPCIYNYPGTADFIYVQVEGNVADINVFDRNLTIKLIKYQ